MKTRYVRVGTTDAAPVHGLQRFALDSAVGCAKFLENVRWIGSCPSGVKVLLDDLEKMSQDTLWHVS